MTLSAADGSISQWQAPLATDFQSQYCTPPMYAPSVYALPGNALGMITQGNCLGTCDPGSGDSLFRWRKAANGSWANNSGGITPSRIQRTTSLGETIPAGAMPSFKGNQQFTPAIADPCTTTNTLTTYTGVYGGPAVVRHDNKLFMAYVKGNADFWNGEIWWAVSSDNGATWTLQTNQRLLVGMAHRGHQAGGSCPEGFGALSMAVTTDAQGTWFNIYGTYFHPSREYNAPWGHVTPMHYRIRYDSANTLGLSATRQLWYGGQFIGHSGKLVWTYDGAYPPGAGEFALDPRSVEAPWASEHFFTRSVTRTSGGRYIMSMAGWVQAGDPLYYRESCDGINWGPVKSLDTTAFFNPNDPNAHPGKTIVGSAFHYGTLDGQTGLWVFLAVGGFCGNVNNAYSGTRIIQAKVTLNTPLQGC